MADFVEVLVFAFAFLLVLIFALSKLIHRKKCEVDCFTSLGLKPVPEVESRISEVLVAEDLYVPGQRESEVSEVYSGVVDGEDVTVLTVSSKNPYPTGGSQVRTFDVAYVGLDDFVFPDIHIQHRSPLLDAVSSSNELKELKFADDDFNERYLVSSSDPDTVKQILSDSLQKQLVALDIVDQVLVFKSGLIVYNQVGGHSSEVTVNRIVSTAPKLKKAFITQ